jgi:AcrR family transcriptional regulator
MSIREGILTQATEMMLRLGYGASSMDELAKRAKVSKGVIFYHFQSKLNLAKEVIKSYYSGIQTKLNSYERSADPVAELNNYINNIVQLLATGELPDRSLLGAFALELADHEVELADLLSQIYESWLADYKALLDKVFTRNSAVVDTTALAGQLISLMEGSLVMYHAKAAHGGIVLMNIKSYQHYLYLLIEKQQL